MLAASIVHRLSRPLASDIELLGNVPTCSFGQNHSYNLPPYCYSMQSVPCWWGIILYFSQIRAF